MTSLVTALLLLLPIATLQEPKAGQADVVPQFKQYTTTDRFRRTVTFYLSDSGEEEKPLALLILGSGGQSVWQRREGRVGAGLQGLLLRSIGDRFHVLVVEKPGVEPFFQPERPGSAEGCSRSFLEEHTFERWVEANVAAMRASQQLPGVRKGGILAIGHSEGGIVAAGAAALDPSITHVADLAGGGPNQLADLKELMGPQVHEEWRKIQSDPMSIERFAWGHPYRRWSTFLATSTQDELLKSKASVFMASGTEDKSVPISSFDSGVKSLREQGRKVEAIRVEGGDHGFRKTSDKSPVVGLEAIFGKISEWYFQTRQGSLKSSWRPRSYEPGLAVRVQQADG